jgi:hypothetical protein
MPIKSIQLTVDLAGLRQRVSALCRLADELQLLAESAVEVEVAAVPQQPPVAAGRPPIAWGSKVSQTFRDRVWWIADTITASQGALFDPNWLMACMAWESGESFSPAKKNMAGSGATGLIQFMPTTATELGTYRGVKLTTAMLAGMTAEDQLNWVYHYFVLQMTRHGKITTLEDCYMAILWPNAIGHQVRGCRSRPPEAHQGHEAGGLTEETTDETIDAVRRSGVHEPDRRLHGRGARSPRPACRDGARRSGRGLCVRDGRRGHESG